MFCENCGSRIPEGSNTCTNCGWTAPGAAPAAPTPAPAAPEPTPVAPQPTPVVVPDPIQTPQSTVAPEPTPVAPQPTPVAPQPASTGATGPKNPLNTPALICGIVSLVISSLGALLFGFLCGLLGVALGVVALVLGVNVKKQTNGAQGMGAFVCGLVGLILGAIFFVGCLACGSCSCGNGKWGAIGGSCMARNDAKKYANDLEDALGDLEKELNKIDWSDFY